MKPSIIVYGPMGCGKTHNAEEMRKFLGLDKVVDTGSDLSSRHVVRSRGDLVLVCDPSEVAKGGLRVLRFADVMRDMGRPVRTIGHRL